MQSPRRIVSRREREQRQRRSRWRLVLLGGAVVLAAYYGLVLTSMSGRDSSAVDLDDAAVERPADRVTLEVEAASLDTSSGSFDIRVRPVPRGDFEAERDGELSRPLQVEVSAPGEPTTTFDFAANQLIDPVGASLETTTPVRRCSTCRGRPSSSSPSWASYSPPRPADTALLEAADDLRT